MEPHGHGVGTYVERGRDLSVVQARSISEREYFLVCRTQGLHSVQQRLDTLLLQYPLLLRGDLRYQIGNTVERDVKRATALQGPQMVRYRVPGYA